MNEHFKKHLEASYTQAFAECARTGHKVGDLDAIFNSIAMATFAELIVRECAGIYDKIDNGNLHMGTDNYLEALQKHFGVEE